MFDLTATTWTKANALFCLDSCEAIYSIPGNPQFQTVDCGDFILVTFRGSKTAKDWLTDAKAWPKPVELPDQPGMRIHDGFWSEFQAIRKAVDLSITALLGVNPLRPVVITGHSLGGALASLYARFCAFPVAFVYTFGQPRTGNKAYADSYNAFIGAKTFRFVARLDIVPRVPFIGYWHHDNECLLTGDGVRVDPSMWSRITTDLWMAGKVWVQSKWKGLDACLVNHHLATSYRPLVEGL